MLNEDVTVEVTFGEARETFSYLLVARGGHLVQSKIVKLPEATKTHNLSFTFTGDLNPEASLIVYFINEDQIVSQRVGIEVKEFLKNFIELDLSTEEAKPGDSVDVNVKTNPKSFVGLLGIDQSVLLLKSGNDLAVSSVLSDFKQFATQTHPEKYEYDEQGRDLKKKRPTPYYNHWSDFQTSGVLFFTNTCEPISMAMCYKTGINKKKMCRQAMDCAEIMCLEEGPSAPKIRKEFPETWIWDTIADDDFDGIRKLSKTVPDSLTSWVLTGFSIDPVNGLGLTKAPKNLKVFQPFFVSLNLPYSLKQGEKVSIPCAIFNYLDTDIEAKVTLFNEHDEFEFVEEGESNASRTKQIAITSNNGASASFVIKPTRVGQISIKVTATSPLAGDGILRLLNVEPEGVTQFENKAVFVDLRDKTSLDAERIQIELPEDRVPDSTHIEVSCIGDILGGTIKNLQNLIRLPCGCGEQNMLNFVPNIVVWNYLKNTNQLTTEVETKLKKFTEIGYQRELKYKHRDGSFSVFGRYDKSGSTWLTAFVAKAFRQAASFVAVEEKIIEEALDWLAKTQTPDGAFPEKGSIFYKEMQGGSSNGVALTAYTLTAFLESKVRLF